MSEGAFPFSRMNIYCLKNHEVPDTVYVIASETPLSLKAAGALAAAAETAGSTTTTSPAQRFYLEERPIRPDPDDGILLRAESLRDVCMALNNGINAKGVQWLSAQRKSVSKPRAVAGKSVLEGEGGAGGRGERIVLSASGGSKRGFTEKELLTASPSVLRTAGVSVKDMLGAPAACALCPFTASNWREFGASDKDVTKILQLVTAHKAEEAQKEWPVD